MPNMTTESTTRISLGDLHSSSAYRRIELQSPLDLLHLRNAALSSARARIDLHLPPEAAFSTPGGRASGSHEGDAMRRTVEREVQAFVERVFEGVRTSVEVNGMGGREAVRWPGEEGGASGGDEFEPYDTRLAKKISSLHAEIESLNVELADMRREGVQEAAGTFKESFLKQSEEVDAIAATWDEQVEQDDSLDGPLNVDIGIGGRQEQLSRTWTDALQGITRLEAGLAKARQRADEADKVVQYMQPKQ